MEVKDLDLTLPCKIWRTELVDASFHFSTFTEQCDDSTAAVKLKLECNTSDWGTVLETERFLNVFGRDCFCETFIRNLRLTRKRLLRYQSRIDTPMRWDPAKVRFADELGLLLVTKLALTKCGWFCGVIFQPADHWFGADGSTPELIRVLFAADEIRTLASALEAQSEEFSNFEQKLLDQQVGRED